MAEQYGLGETLCDPPGANIDIVFVHGLGGDRIRTWTWENNDRVVFWPKDLLPEACPTARILSFGYNASFAHFYPFYGPKFMPEQLTIEDHSTALLQSLIGLRAMTETSDRPIIFICHSLGGLVCANALSRHYGTDEACASLVDNTIGIIFLGTPFEGSSKAKWATRALNMLDWISTTHKEDINDLQERSARLIDINHDFQKFLKARDRSKNTQFVEVACFFEQYAMYNRVRRIGIIVPKESASLPGIDPQSIQANHVDMCKFEDEDREGYRNVSQLLAQWISRFQQRSNTSMGESQQYSVRFGDVNFANKIENNRGIVAGQVYSTATGGVKMTGTNITYNNTAGEV
ncbi:hypothetical protein FE257_010743 [Aspergillus nanangensis]|uniref:AB hydrolase-1 domain-containing protein n=1 Tax=Aspergillus nanangensis TaxID=2582783 RepID=A0AAD4CVE9_ASPNN|nr:hypothetical protein FE257_010743 [Aspergillus nanangensis]